MKSILEKIYDGEVNVAEYMLVKGKKYSELGKEIEDEKQYLIRILSPEDGKRIEHFEDLCGQSAEIEKKAAFGYGFKLGAAVTLEVLGGNEK